MAARRRNSTVRHMIDIRTGRQKSAGGIGLIPAGGGTFPHLGNVPTGECQPLTSSALGPSSLTSLSLVSARMASRRA